MRHQKYRACFSTISAIGACVALGTTPANGQDLLNDNITFSGGALHLELFSSPGATNNKLISTRTQPGDTSSIYAAGQYGEIFQIDSSGNSSEWFNFNNAVNSAYGGSAGNYTLDNPGSAHGGLQSFAFHPEFATNGKFYISAVVNEPTSGSGYNYLGNSSSGSGADSVVVEWTYNHGTGQVDANSHRELFRVQMPTFDHLIKGISFNHYAQQGDEDYGLLYVAHGDGSVQSATAGGGLNTDDALGKVLRINPLQDGSNPYSTPNSAFAGDANTLDEIYTLGHRNPHNISFAQDANGNTYAIVAEIGRDNVEEINLLQAGGNYGWADREGTFIHNGSGGYINGLSDLTDNEWAENDYIYPVAQYDHDASPGDGFVGSAVAGGFVIANGSDPDLQGQYIFADFAFKSGHVYHADFADMLAAHTQLADGELPDELTQADIYRLTLTLDSDGDGDIDVTADNLNSLFGTSRNDVRFGMGPGGEMYITSKQTGDIYLVTNSVGVVPEPGSFVCLLILGSVMTRRRRS